MAPAVFLTLMLGQDPAGAAGDADQLARIRRALAEAPAITVLPAPRIEGPVFRITVFGGKPARPLWVDWSAVPSYVRPRFPSYHYEFLQQVTPEEFRAGTLYPAGIPVDRVIATLVKRIRAANRKMGEAAARKEVQQALEELLACRANPDRPGC